MNHGITPMRSENNRKELRKFAETLANVQQMVVVGSHIGESAEIFAEYVEFFTCVDVWFENEPGYRKFWNGAYTWANVKHLRLPSVAAADFFQDGELDAVYIDVSHDYESVKADILAWGPKLRPGGILSGHDYGPHAPGVVRAVNELIGKPSMVYGETSWVA